MRRPGRSILFVIVASIACAEVTGPAPRLEPGEEPAIDTLPPALPELDPDAHVAELTPAAAFEFLSATSQFESPLLGYAGTPSPAAGAWRTIVAAPDAADTFMDLYESAATVEGRLYALLGLYATDRAAAAVKAADPAWADVEARTQFGCIVSTFAARSLIVDLGRPEWVTWFLSGEDPD
jgi:hypothetical protein